MAKFKNIVIPVSQSEQKLLDRMIPAWLYQNDKNRGQLRDSYDEYVELYTSYRDVLNFHSPMLTRNSKDPAKLQGWFKMSVGAPKLKGTRHYRLPNHSVMLYLGDTNAYIVTDTKYELKKFRWDNICKIATKMFELRQGDPWDLNKILYDKISVHPHVSSDNAPCLGYFSEAFSRTVASGNLDALKEVAFSFLCNWTRNDAYWDINHEYTFWYDYMYQLGWDYNEYLMLQKLMDQVYKINGGNGRFHLSAVSKHNDKLSQLRSLGWSEADLYVYGRLFAMLKSDTKDTSDGKIKFLTDMARALTVNYGRRLRTLNTGCDLLNVTNVKPLMDIAVVNNSNQGLQTHNAETLQLHNFSVGEVISYSADRILNDMDTLLHSPASSLQQEYSSIDLRLVKRMTFREEYRTINNNISADEAFKLIGRKIARFNSSTDKITRSNGWLFLLRSLATFAKYQDDICEVEYDDTWSFEELYDVKQMLVYIKKYYYYYEYGIDGLTHAQTSDVINRMSIQIGKRIYSMFNNLQGILENDAFKSRWRHFIHARVKDNVIKQLRNTIRSLENERNNNIHRCNNNGLGVQTFDSYHDGSENQISIASF